MEENGISVAENQVLAGLAESSPTCNRVLLGESLTPLGTGICMSEVVTWLPWIASVSLQELPLSCKELSSFSQALLRHPSAGD